VTKLERLNDRANLNLVGCLIAVAMLGMSIAESPCAHAQAEVREGAAVSLNTGVPKQVENVTVEQKLGGQIQLNLPMTDSVGRRVKTGYFIDGTKPTIITLNYSNCPMFCSVQLDQLTKSLSELDLQIGRDFQMLTVSIVPTRSLKRLPRPRQLRRYARPNATDGRGWLGLLHCPAAHHHSLG
jgi:protein SCO1/2